MNADIVITHSKVPDTVLIEGNAYPVYTTLGLTKEEDFYVEIEFKSLDQNTIFDVAAFNKVPKALMFNSELADLEGYAITHIVIERMHTNNRYEMVDRKSVV